MLENVINSCQTSLQPKDLYTKMDLPTWRHTETLAISEENSNKVTPIYSTSHPPQKQPNPSRIQAHLANERTYLAWMRTAIALMGFGVVIVRLRVLHPPLVPHTGIGWKLGLMFSLVGLITVFLSTRQYFGVRDQIETDTYKPTDRWIILFSLAIALLGAGIIYFVFTAPLNPVNLMLAE